MAVMRQKKGKILNDLVLKTRFFWNGVIW